MNQNQNNHNELSLKNITSLQDFTTTFQNACGAVPYGMINDYMFRAVLQYNNKVLRGLICALLHLSEDKVKSVTITNPIILGEAIELKECRLDINLLLNGSSKINLEMQVANRYNWNERSVTYLCRSFDVLEHGQDYQEVKPVINICFLDYTLFDEFPEFYATYKLENVKYHQIYSDSLTLSVVDLTRIDLATEEDKEYHIDYWAKLFKATTWEEIKVLAAKNEYMNEASNTMYMMSADERIRKQCRDREEYYQDRRKDQKRIADRDDIIAQQRDDLAKKDDTIAQQRDIIAQQNDAITQYQAQIQSLIDKYEKPNKLLQ